VRIGQAIRAYELGRAAALVGVTALADPQQGTGPWAVQLYALGFHDERQRMRAENRLAQLPLALEGSHVA
jgi:hypothetical protein